MSVLIDPPLWPAHGTFFSHLVSDSSVDELHAFATEAGLPPGAFDRDHYDVPLREHERLVSLGAEPVSAGELTRRLIRGGVRVPARERPDRHDAWLRRRFDELLPGRSEVREPLLARWSEPHRHYHDRRHLSEVLRSLDWLAAQELDQASHASTRDTVLVAQLAGWWHDAVYQGVAGQDEQESAALARRDLAEPDADRAAGAPSAAVVQRVSDAILMTVEHLPGGDPAQTLLNDADLRVLARPEASYDRYVAQVRRDYAHVEDADFARGRAQVLRSLLGGERLYVTQAGHQAWEATARANLERELRGLES
ncbi:DUF4031 domain-containing protein [Galactobacter caseinivorans]|uniref:DUF4031 domain-containing protein n=1 Tax=Galactobacter caseinivorans TaxID=2676123 RepID=A0A496PG96_9MICC|nr:DUF4031 domain-containing protein [Galactobacter caseinivorans]RKW69438.1 DUF4031 domain-containing protein [Galactobacter caseinivorans]